MSEWYDTEGDDIDIDHKDKEVNIYVTHNDCGAIYKTLTFEQVEKIYDAMLANRWSIAKTCLRD